MEEKNLKIRLGFLLLLWVIGIAFSISTIAVTVYVVAMVVKSVFGL